MTTKLEAMSLRQRSAQTSDRPPSETSQQPTSRREKDTATITHPRRGIRLNRVLGRIVPVILLVYAACTYDLVVLRYAYQYLHIQQRRTWTPILWLLPAHGLFLWSLKTYLRVFFAQDGSAASEARKRGGSMPWLRARLGASFTDPDEEQRQDEKRIAEAIRSLTARSQATNVRLELCQPDGEPIRCWRDKCSGRVKAFRTRHCGDCGKCRVGFDHHCAWFDNDVTAPATLRPFIGFLLSVPPLLLFVLAPILPTAGRTLARIHAFSKSDAELRAAWWSRKYSWVGGPAFRWMVGFALGASRWTRATPDRLPHETPRAPILIALGGMFTFVAVALATSSLTHLRYGELTIDFERLKAYRKLERQLVRLEQEGDAKRKGKVESIRQKMESLAPVQHFKVSWTEKGLAERQEKIVSLSMDEGLLSHGNPWTNLRRFLIDSMDTRPPWSLSDAALRKVLDKASIPLSQP